VIFTAVSLFLLNLEIGYFFYKNAFALVKFVGDKLGNIRLKIHFILVEIYSGAVLLLKLTICKGYILYVSVVTYNKGGVFANEPTVLELYIGDFSVYVCSANNDRLTLAPPVACINFCICLDIFEFCISYIPVIAAEYSKRSVGTDYLDILTAYFENECSIINTARSLYCHKNTMTYKINKIKDILGYDILDNENRMKIMISIHIMKLRTGRF